MENNTSLQQQLLEAGVHFGHLKKKWNPKMLPYIFAEKKGIHIIDLNKTVEGLQDAAAALKSIAKSGKKIMFVATKKQAKEIVSETARRVNMPYVTERWLGGMLTNFSTIRKSVKKMQSIEKMLSDGTFENVTKKERLTLTRDKEKMEKVLGGIAQLARVPSALFIVDIAHEHIALLEAKRLGIATFGMVDTNSDPTKVDFAIPANDDATKSISIIVNYIAAAIAEGLSERAVEKTDDVTEEEDTDDSAANFDVEGGDDRERNRRGRGPGGAGGPGRGPGGPGRGPGGAGRGPGGPGRGPGGGGSRPGGAGGGQRRPSGAGGGGRGPGGPGRGPGGGSR
ncbi:SSU ribosomal protein S2P [Chitinophaga costaii]|uniref:Small ribosomal subunit protein uS2 n=1 Tax=Chitinophaga costaii TaxID=1335309 RepID=A0A1C4A8X8_9BACT|nr:30S ribosomal protein S2 [Chitinophaga costaii]PUZ26508.1 30S ribosomal protein S2 [Chitinophaga costaii]SCB91067.1 SSU ribosomal protein S2P [Chitinophaga costaii]